MFSKSIPNHLHPCLTYLLFLLLLPPEMSSSSSSRAAAFGIRFFVHRRGTTTTTTVPSFTARYFSASSSSSSSSFLSEYRKHQQNQQQQQQQPQQPSRSRPRRQQQRNPKSHPPHERLKRTQLNSMTSSDNDFDARRKKRESSISKSHGDRQQSSPRRRSSHHMKRTSTPSKTTRYAVTSDDNPESSPSPPPPKFVSFLDSIDEKVQQLERQRDDDDDELSRFQTSTSTTTGAKSIFDTLPTTLPPTTTKNTYPQPQFEAYFSTISAVLDSDRFRKKKTLVPDIEIIRSWLLQNHPRVAIHLPSLLKTNTTSFTSDSDARTRFQSELQHQRDVFLKSTDFSPEQTKLSLRALQVLGDHCAKYAITAPLEIAWEKVKEAGMIPSEKHLSTYLYVVGTAGSGLSSSENLLDAMTNNGSVLDLMSGHGWEKEEKVLVATEEGGLEERDIPGEVATFHDLLYQPTEKSISLRVKRLVAKGDAMGAEKLLDTLPNSKGETDEVLRLRTYLPVLKAYCNQRDCTSALKLFRRMRESPGVNMEPENCVLLIAALAENGWFRPDAAPLEGATELNYTHPSGPRFFDALASEMASEVLEINSASARRLYNAFYSSFHTLHPHLQHLPPLATIPLDNDPLSSPQQQMILNRVSINATTAKCPKSNIKLRLIQLDETSRKQFHDGLLQKASVQFELFTKGENAVKRGNAVVEDVEHAERELKKFADWLNTREGEPFTAIIDGANVAYFGQNFDQGRFNYHQIQFLVDALESKGETPLVILPSKYAQPFFNSNTGSSQGRRQKLKNDEIEIMNRLNSTGKLYRVPPRCLDDFYWMLASVSDQTNSRNHRNLDVTPSSNERFPGTRPMLLTNDQMRDHKLELLDTRLFRRWTSSHIVNYNFTAFVDGECVDREIGFSAPDFFSREIQGNEEDGGGDGAMVWHFPVSDWDWNERFCIKIPN